MNRTVLGFCLICLSAMMLIFCPLIALWAGSENWRLVKDPLVATFYVALIHTIAGYWLLIMTPVQKWLARKNKNNETQS